MMGVKINRELKRAKESDNMSCKESIYSQLRLIGTPVNRENRLIGTNL